MTVFSPKHSSLLDQTEKTIFDNIRKYCALEGTTTNEKYILGPFDGRDEMIWSKYCAVKSFEKTKSSIHRLQNQMHKVHVPLKSISKYQQKRKFDQYICDGIFTTSSFELINREKYRSENVKEHIRGLSSPLSCSIISDKKQTLLPGIKERVFSTLDDKGEYCEICQEDNSYLSDSEDSITESSYPMYQGSMKIQPAYLMGSSFSLSTEVSLNDNPKMDFVEVSKSFIDENFIDSRTSLSLSSMEEDTKLVVNRLLPSKGNHLPRPIIPIGPRFQAEVREAGTHIKQHYGDDSLKWLGTQILPIPIIS